MSHLDVPEILEYATTDELWKELARRSKCAFLVHMPVRNHPDEHVIQHEVKGDLLIVYDILTKYASNPMRLRASNRKRIRRHDEK